MTTRIILTLLPFALPLYVVRFQVGPIPTTLLEVVILAALGAWVLTEREGLWTRIRKSSKACLTIPILIFFLAGTISVFVAPGTVAALGLWRAYFLEPILVLIMLRDLVRTDEDRRRLMTSLAGVTILVVAWTVLQRLGVLPIPPPWDAPPQGIRATGPFPFPNAVALFVVPIGALCLSFLSFPHSILSFRILQAKRGKSGIHIERNWIPAYAGMTVLILGFLSALIASFLAESDGGMIALLAALGVVLLRNARTRLPTILVSIVALVSIFSISAIREPLLEKVLFKDWSGMVRLVMWDEASAMLRDHPILGAGLGAYPDVIVPYHGAEWMEIFQYPHNIILNFWSEIGLLGLVAFAWILIRWYRASPVLALPVIAAILIHGLVDVPYFKNDLAILFWMLIVVTTFNVNSRQRL